MSYQDTKLVYFTDITPDVRLLQFEHDEEWDYEPGQHTVLKFDNDGEEVHRPYTPVNLPGTNRFALAVKKYENGTASVYLHERQVGDKLKFSQPKGNLKIRDFKEDVVLLSTGTGATPMMAMLREYLRKGEGSVDYIHGEKQKEDLLFKESLNILESEHSELNVEYTLTRQEWSGRTGYVQEHIQDVVGDLEEKTFYVCGVPAMVVDTKDKLKELGVPESRIISEGWEEDSVSE